MCNEDCCIKSMGMMNENEKNERIYEINKEKRCEEKENVVQYIF